MDSSQFSYEAPGPSYESPDDGQPGAPAGGSRPPRPVPQNVPSLPSPLDPADPLPLGTPGDPSNPASPVGTQPVTAYPVPVSYPAYVAPAPLGRPGYPAYGGGAVGPPTSISRFPYPYPVLPTPVVVRHSLRRRSWIWVVVVSALLSALVGGLVGAEVGSNSQQTIVKQFFPNESALAKPQDIQEILAKVEPAVVSINANSGSGGAGGDFVESAGSGMILTSDGEVLTNDHVVAGSTSVTVTLFGQTNALPSHVLGTDPSNDVSLIQIDGASNLPTVTLGDSSQTRVGDAVLAIGNALALAGGPTVTQGIVSAEGRTLAAQNDDGQTEQLTGLLQTDAAINPGNSGGPLVNSLAQVVGMNTAVASSTTGNAPTENIGFAITVDSVKPLLPQLRKGGTGGAGTSATPVLPSANSAYMGVTVGPVTPSLQQLDHLTPSSGALIISVEPGSPAQKAALHADDVIVSFNGAVIQSPEDLTAAIHPLSAGDHVVVGLYRGSTRLDVGVTLGARPPTG